MADGFDCLFLPDAADPAVAVDGGGKIVRINQLVRLFTSCSISLQNRLPLLRFGYELTPSFVMLFSHIKIRRPVFSLCVHFISPFDCPRKSW